MGFPSRFDQAPTAAAGTLILLMIGCLGFPPQPARSAAVAPPSRAAFEAARRGQVEKLDTFLRRTRDPLPLRDRHGSTLLMYAAWGGDPRTVDRLLEAGADVNARNHAGITALMDAVLGRHPGVVRLLLEHGADPTARDRYGRSVLERALMEPHPEILSMFRERGISDPDLSQELGDELLLACRNLNLERVDRLVSSGVSPNARSPKGHTPLIVAALRESPELARMMLEAGADTEAVLIRGDLEGFSALHLAAFRGDTRIMRMLHDHGMDVDHRVTRGPRSGMTPLMVAVRASEPAAVAWLLERGGDVNAVDQRGRTPLILAIREGNLDLVRRLHGAGARLDDLPDDVPNPLGVARDQRRWRIYGFLKSRVDNSASEDETAPKPSDRNGP